MMHNQALQIELYTDGGVIGSNPSKAGGTWAFRVIQDGKVTNQYSGIVTPEQMGLPYITNNLTEMRAVVRGLLTVSYIHPDFAGTVYSDSMVTLGRIFCGWKWSGIPPVLRNEFNEARAGLKQWEKIRWVLLDGHPTHAHLAAGIGKHGHAVSLHNVWCDKECGRLAAQYKKGTAILEGAQS